MFETLKLLGLGLAIVVLIKTLKPAVLLYFLLKQQLRVPTLRIVDAESIPMDVRTYLSAGAERLIPLGFAPSHWALLTSTEVTARGEVFVLELVHETLEVTASVSAGYLGVGYRINFAATFEDGQRLESCHGESSSLCFPIPDTEIVDTHEPSVEGLWKVFHARFTERRTKSRAVRVDALESIAEFDRRAVRMIDGARDVLKPAREAGRYELTFRQAFTVAVRMSKSAGAVAKWRAARGELERGSVLESEQIRSFHVARDLAERRNTRFGIAATLVVTALLFVLSVTHLFDPGELMVVVGVLMFHELGHYAAMRMFGYRDTSIFFIPFFGAAASGVKRDASIHEQLIVLLAGPAPGLLLAAILTIFTPGLLEHPQGRSAIMLLAIINLINLLPIFPLDGGKIVQLVFSNTRPGFEVLFRGFGACVLFATGILIGDVFTAALGTLLALSIPAAKRSAAAVYQIRQWGPIPDDEDAQLALAFRELRVHQPSLPPLQHVAIVVPIAPRLRTPRLSLLGTMSWLGIYGAGVVGGLMMMALPTLAVGDDIPEDSYHPLVCGDVAALQRDVHDGLGTFRMRCGATDSQVAELAEAVNGFEALPSAGCLLAPWHTNSPLTAAQVRARETIAQLNALGRKQIERGESGSAAKIRAQRVLASFAEKHADSPTFDRSVAQLYVTYLRGDEQPDALGRPTPLAVQLGLRSDRCGIEEQDEYTAAILDERGAMILGRRNDLRSGLTEMANYLCERGCTLEYMTKERAQSDD